MNHFNSYLSLLDQKCVCPVNHVGALGAEAVLLKIVVKRGPDDGVGQQNHLLSTLLLHAVPSLHPVRHRHQLPHLEAVEATPPTTPVPPPTTTFTRFSRASFGQFLRQP